MKKAIPPLPELKIPILASPIQACIWRNDHGEFFVTRNFSDDFPIWRKYQRLGWALRYVNQSHKTLDKRAARV